MHGRMHESATCLSRCVASHTYLGQGCGVALKVIGERVDTRARLFDVHETERKVRQPYRKRGHACK